MQAEIESIVGERVVGIDRVEGGGYTPAGRHRAFLDDGRTVFVKSAVDELSADWLRTEIRVYTSLHGPFLPAFHGWAEHDGLPLVVLEDLGDAHWPPPWREGDVEAVQGALRELAVGPVPDGIEPVPREDLAHEWREVERDPEPFLSTGVASRAWLAENLATLRDVAGRAPFAGDDLLHLDVRSDNIALRAGRAVLVDWNWVCVGNALLDVVGWAPSLHREGGPSPDDFVAGPGVPEFAAALAGLWAARAGLPPPATGPRVREEQRGATRSRAPLGLPAPGNPGTVKAAAREGDGVARGYLQLCSDLRFHRATMLAFEEATGLAADAYWIEARPGGAPSWADNTRASRLAHRRGAVFMGWAAHGDECLGFPGDANERIADRLMHTLRKRAEEFPKATHIGLFAHGDEVHVMNPARG